MIRILGATIALVMLLSIFVPARARGDHYIFSGPGENRLFSCSGAFPEETKKEIAEAKKNGTTACVTGTNPKPKLCHLLPYETDYNKNWEEKWNKDHPNALFPKVEVKTLIIPGDIENTTPGNIYKPVYKATSSQIVNVYTDPKTGRIIRFTVERRDPYDVPNPDGLVEYIDPRVPSPHADGALKNQLSPYLSGETVEAQGKQFDAMLNGWLYDADAENCDFAKRHNREVRYAADHSARNVDAFYAKACDDKDPLCGCRTMVEGEGFGCNPRRARETTTAGQSFNRIEAVINAIPEGEFDPRYASTDWNEEFNLALLQTAREGLMRTQVGIISTAGDHSELRDFALGPDEHGSDCPGKFNTDFESKRTAYKTLLKNGMDAKKHAAAEWASTRQMMLEAIELKTHDCAVRNSYGFGAFQKTGDRKNPFIRDNEAEARKKAAVANRARVWGLLEKRTESFDGYYSRINSLMSSSKLFAGVDFALFNDDKKCRNADSRASFSRLKSQIAKMQPDDELSKFMMKPDGVLGEVRKGKLEALREMRAMQNDFTKQCKEAAKPYSPGWFNGLLGESGVTLFTKAELMHAMLHKYTSEGRYGDLKFFHEQWCEKSGQKSTAALRDGVVLGVAAVALMAVPVVGEVAGSATLEIVAESFMFNAIATGAIVVGAGMAVKNVSDAYDNKDTAERLFAANIGTYETMDEAGKEIFTAWVEATVGVGLSAFQVANFTKTLAASLAVGRGLSTKEVQLYKQVIKSIKDGEIPQSALLEVMGSKNACPKGDCTDAFAKLAKLVSGAGKEESGALSLAAVDDGAAPTRPEGMHSSERRQAFVRQKQDLEAKKAAEEIARATDVITRADPGAQYSVFSNGGGTSVIFKNARNPGSVFKVTGKGNMDAGMKQRWHERMLKLYGKLKDRGFKVAEVRKVDQFDGEYIYEIEEIVGPTVSEMRAAYKTEWERQPEMFKAVRQFDARVNAERPLLRQEMGDEFGLQLESNELISGKRIKDAVIDAKRDNLVMPAIKSADCKQCIPVKVMREGKEVTYLVDPANVEPVFIDW